MCVADCVKWQSRISVLTTNAKNRFSLKLFSPGLIPDTSVSGWQIKTSIFQLPFFLFLCFVSKHLFHIISWGYFQVFLHGHFFSSKLTCSLCQPQLICNECKSVTERVVKTLFSFFFYNTDSLTRILLFLLRARARREGKEWSQKDCEEWKRGGAHAHSSTEPFLQRLRWPNKIFIHPTTPFTPPPFLHP